MSGREQFKPFDVAEYLATPEDRAAYLQAMIEDSGGDSTVIATAIGDVARALGMSEIARGAGVAREALYKALSPDGNPELKTITKVLQTMGLVLAVTPGHGGEESYRPVPIPRRSARLKTEPVPGGLLLAAKAAAGASLSGRSMKKAASRPRSAKKAKR